MTLEQTQAVFQTTQWTLMGRLRSGSAEERTAAMDAVVRRYWPAVYAWLRREGYKREEAGEIVQHFFADVILARDLFGRTEEANGRLRSLVLVALRRFLVDRHRRQCAWGGDSCIALGDLPVEEKLVEAVRAETPDEAFDRRWALAVLQETLARCERHMMESGRAGHWAVFHARVVSPARSGCMPPPLAGLAAESGFASAADAAAAVQVVKRRMLLLLREVVAETITSAQEQEDEYRRLLALLA